MTRDFGVDARRDAAQVLLNAEEYDDELADAYDARDFATGMMANDYTTRNLEGDETPEPSAEPSEEELPDVHATRPARPPSHTRPLSLCERALAQVIVKASANTPCTLKPLPESHMQKGTVAILVLKADGRKELYR